MNTVEEPLWRALRTGDRVRIVSMPTEFSQPGHLLFNETRQIYEQLIAEGRVLTVNRIDEWACPWVEFTHESNDGAKEYHSLMISHDGLERVD